MTLHAKLPALKDTPRTAAHVLVDQLIAQGVTHVFCIPGESYLPVLDALVDSGIAVTVCRHEGGAAMMAEAHGKATGRPGICFVTRGPGATNAAAGIHVASQDSTPLILFVGQVERRFLGRDAVQELNYPAVFGSMTKWAAQIDEPARMAEYVGRAFSIAMAGRPGPVVLALPRDVLGAPADCADRPRITPAESEPGTAQMAALEDLLAEAKRPILLLGGSRWNDTARAQIARFAERFGLPVATSYRRGPLFDQSHPNYAGDLGLFANPKLVARIKASDLVIVAGARLNQTTTQDYSLLESPETVLVHAYPEASEIGRVFAPRLGIPASPQGFAAALDGLVPRNAPTWTAQTEAANAEYRAFSDAPLAQPGAVNLSTIMIWLRENLPADAILCNGAGGFAAWIHRFYRFRNFATHFAPVSQSMGYGVPAAVALKQLYPERAVIAISGDGDFLMSGQEFSTAVQYGLPIICLVLDNAMYGSIRLHQERNYPGRVSATGLTNPDFAALARAAGGFGVTVEKTEDFAAAFASAQASNLPAIIHVKYDSDGVAPGVTLSGARAKASA
jgi:acetolactate synthase-1/2/3 large subunit